MFSHLLPITLLLLGSCWESSTAWTVQVPMTTSTRSRGSTRRFVSTALADAVVTTTTSAEIIPREVLFGNPTFSSPKLSPDGRYLAYLSPNQIMS